MFNKITYISTATTTHVATSGSGTIHSINIPVNTGGTVTFQSVATTPIVYFTLPVATVANSYVFDSVFSNGLDIVTSSGDVVIATTAQ